MSTKTLRKRIALVAVAALGAGVLSVAPANAANVTYAAALLSALPVTLFFLWAQRWFINAIAGTGNDS